MIRSIGHLAFGGPVAAVRLPLELAGGVRVGVDREPAAVLDRHVEQLARRVETLGPAVDLDRRAELGAGREHVVGVELARRAPADHPARAVAEDVDVRRRHGEHHPLGHLRLVHPQLRVHARDDDVESLQHVVGEIEGTVLEDVDLHAAQDPEVVPGRGDVGVDRGDLVELLGQPLPVETVGDREAGGMVGLHHVLVAERHRRRRHRLDRWRRRRSTWSAGGSRPSARRGRPGRPR